MQKPPFRLSRYNEWGNGIWNLQKQGLHDAALARYHWLGFICGSDDHEQLGKLNAIMSGKIMQAPELLKHRVLLAVSFFDGSSSLSHRSGGTPVMMQDQLNVQDLKWQLPDPP